MGSATYTKLLDVDEVHVPPRKPKQSSWMKWCCFAFLLVIGLVVLMAGVAGTWAYFWTKHQVQRFTVTQPVLLPIIDMPKEELEIVKDRAKLFVDTLKAGKTPDYDLTVTAEEINAFAAQSDYLRGNIYVNITENLVAVETSLPAQGLPGGKGRYFVSNGRVQVDRDMVTTQLETTTDSFEGNILYAEFHTFMDHGKFNVNLLSGQFLDWIVPQDFIDEKNNLMDEIDCPDMARIVDGIERIAIQNDEIIIQARRDPKSLDDDTEKIVLKTRNNGARALLSRMLF